MPLWDKGYFKLKAQESQQTQQEASLEPPFHWLKVETSEKWGLPKVSSPAEALQPEKSQKVSTEMDLNKQILPPLVSLVYLPPHRLLRLEI